MTNSGSEAEETEGVVVHDLCAETISSQATQENDSQSYVWDEGKCIGCNAKQQQRKAICCRLWPRAA
jgi:hypothetical protein